MWRGSKEWYNLTLWSIMFPVWCFVLRTLLRVNTCTVRYVQIITKLKTLFINWQRLLLSLKYYCDFTFFKTCFTIFNLSINCCAGPWNSSWCKKSMEIDKRYPRIWFVVKFKAKVIWHACNTIWSLKETCCRIWTLQEFMDNRIWYNKSFNVTA